MSQLTLKTSIALLLAPTAVMANTPHVELDPINITVSRSPQVASQTPTRVAVIGEKDIHQNPSLNLSDVLKQDASLVNRSQWGGIGQPSSLSLRGTNATHTLVLKDGARLNSQNGLSPLYPTFLDLTDIERIEIAKGPASVQYGADAVAGVVQMISKTPTKTGASVTGIWGENSTYKAIVKGDLVADNGLYATVSGQRLESDGTRIFNTQDKNDKAGYEQKGYSAKVGYDNQALTASIGISQNKGVNEYSDDGITSNNAQRLFDNQIITAKTSYKINDQLTISGRHSIIKDDQTIQSQYPTHYNTKNKDSDINVKWAFTPHQNILVGVSHLSAEYDSSNITNTRQDNKSTGYYLQHQYNANNLNTQVGVRLEDNERFGNHTVGQGAIRYHFTPATSIYANIGSAFRAPTLDEMYSTWYIANPNLKPEESLSYELGLDHRIAQNTALSLSAYHTEVENLIRSTCLNNPSSNYCFGNTQNTNIDKATFTGGEIGLKWSKDDLFATAHYAYVKTEDKSQNSTNQGKSLSYRPEHKGVLMLGYDDGKYGINSTITAHGKSYANNANTVKVGGYATIDLNTHWHVSPYVKVFGNVQNVGNVEYKTANYFGNQWYINGGRQANIGVTLSY